MSSDLQPQKATDPNQYDSSELDWSIHGAEDTPSRKHFRNGLEQIIPSGTLKDKRVIDIGSGVGQLYNWMRDQGVQEIVGIDPSVRNVKTSTKLYPWALTIRSTLHELAESNEKLFDVAIVVLVFEHILDLNEAFADVKRLLVDGGNLYLIIGDKDYHLNNDKELRKSLISVKIIKDLGNGVVETQTIKDLKDGTQSVLYDIFRPIDLIRNAAKENGFSIVLEKPICGFPSTPAENTVICHMFAFKLKI